MTCFTDTQKNRKWDWGRRADTPERPPRLLWSKGDLFCFALVGLQHPQGVSAVLHHLWKGHSELLHWGGWDLNTPPALLRPILLLPPLQSASPIFSLPSPHSISCATVHCTGSQNTQCISPVCTYFQTAHLVQFIAVLGRDSNGLDMKLTNGN